MSLNILGNSIRGLLRRPSPQSVLLVEGWRDLSQSYSMVNQYQLLELVKRTEFRLYHRDMPYASSAWTADSAFSGFDARRSAILDSLYDLPGGRPDVTYRIDYPFRIEVAPSGRTFVQGTSEFKTLRDEAFRGGAAALRAHRAHPVTIITPSHWSKQGFLAYGFEDHQVEVVPHGVDFQIYRPLAPEHRAAVRAQLGIAPGDFAFLNIGVMTWNKGVDLLLRAFARVRRKHRQARLLLKDASKLYNSSAADLVGAMRSQYSEEFGDHVLEGITITTENFNLAQLAELYGACDAYVSPYRAEGFGLTPLEAAACGVPVAVTHGGATDDYARPSFALKIPSQADCRAGKHYREPDLESLTGVMMCLVERDTPGIDPRAAMDFLRANFSWDGVAGRLAALFTASRP